MSEALLFSIFSTRQTISREDGSARIHFVHPREDNDASQPMAVRHELLRWVTRRFASFHIDIPLIHALGLGRHSV